MELQLFSTQDGRPLDWQVFLNHPLGRLYETIPFSDYTRIFGYCPPKTGPKPWFDLRGGIALQVLKAYYGFSDVKLIESLNHNKMMQYFCGINLKVGQMIRDEGVVSRWRMRLGQALKTDNILTELQLSNVAHWKDSMDQLHTNLSDATCYESYVRYPTDVKLLWECTQYLYGQIKVICRYIGMLMPRSRYKDQKTKKKTYKTRRKRTKSLLYH